MHIRKARLAMYLAFHELETFGSENVCYAGVLYVQVDQQPVNLSGWPILLQPSACSRLAFVGSSHQVPLQATAGNAFSVLVETQDSLQQRICQVSCNLPAVYTCMSTQSRLMHDNSTYTGYQWHEFGPQDVY